MPSARRRRAGHVLSGLASLVLLLTVLVGYGQHAFGNADQFAGRAADALRDPDVREITAGRVTDRLVVQNESDLIALRPVIQSVVERVVGGRAFTSLFEAGVADVHRSLFDGTAGTVTLTVRDVGTVSAEVLRQVRPDLAEQLRATGDIELLSADLGAVTSDAVRFAARVRALAWGAAFALIALVVAALAVGADRRRTVTALAVGSASAGVLIVIALLVGQQLAIGSGGSAERQAARAAVFDAFLGDLRTVAWALVVMGAVGAAAASSLLKPMPLGEPVRRAVRFVLREPDGVAARALRGATILALGVVLLVARETTIAVLLTLIGAYLAYEGARVLLLLTYRPPDPSLAVERERPARRYVPVAIAVAVVVFGTTALAASDVIDAPLPKRGVCNGDRELCDRPFNEVALVATHNAMSAPLPGWFFAEQDASIPDQLDDGVRGLLIDTYYADRLPNGQYRTAFDDADAEKKAGGEISPDALAAAERIRDQLGFAGEGKRGIYLCHGFCELGATPLSEVLAQLRAFLVANPDDEVVIVHQDQIRPEDFVKAIRDADLEPLIYRGPVDGEWPTLREMIARNQRLVILNENRAGVAPWNHLVYDGAVQETPFAFTEVAQLNDPAQREKSCVPNRGGTTAPLLLMNHWVNTPPAPRPSLAKQVNALDPLLARARTCKRVRGQIPNLVAVNFYRRGDVFAAVDRLNGVTVRERR